VRPAGRGPALRFVESGITLDFAAARSAVRHDSADGHGNRVWPGVDFCVEDDAELLWVEVKNWQPSGLPARLRGAKRRAFVGALKSGSLVRGLRGKFLGTTAFLAWTGQADLRPVRYIALVEPLRPTDSPLLMAVNDRLRSPMAGPWRCGITVAIMGLAEWNARFSDYPGAASP